MALVLVIDKGKRLPCHLRQNRSGDRDRKGSVDTGASDRLGFRPQELTVRTERQRGKTAGEQGLDCSPGACQTTVGAEEVVQQQGLERAAWRRCQLRKTLMERGRGGVDAERRRPRAVECERPRESGVQSGDRTGR